MAIKVVITGPESTGKSALTMHLAQTFDAPYALEFARSYLEQLGRPYSQTDLLAIAQGQTLWNTPPAGADLFFCDTDLLNIQIWSHFKFGFCDAAITAAATQQLPTLYLLCDVDLPWEADPLREHPHQRKLLFDLHLRAVAATGIPFKIISGIGPKRLKAAEDAVRGFFG
jgi:nicotinamide riboside kinase